MWRTKSSCGRGYCWTVRVIYSVTRKKGWDSSYTWMGTSGWWEGLKHWLCMPLYVSSPTLDPGQIIFFQNSLLGAEAITCSEHRIYTFEKKIKPIATLVNPYLGTQTSYRIPKAQKSNSELSFLLTSVGVVCNNFRKSGHSFCYSEFGVGV